MRGSAGAITATPVATGSRIKLSLGRIVRLGLGVAIIAAGVAIYGPQLLYTTSSEAVLNARVITITAPIVGRVVTTPLPEGTVVARGTPLLMIQNPTVDRSRLHELEATRTRTQMEIQGAKHLRDVLATQIGVLEEQDAAYRAATVTRLTLAAKVAQADAAAAAAAATDARHDFERKRALRAANTVSIADADHAEHVAARTEAVAESTRLVTQRLEEELAAAKRGILVGADRNDVPYSQQRADEFRVRKAEAEAQIATLATRLAQTELQLMAEQERDQRLAGTELTAPVSGVVWRPLVSSGSAVGQNSDLMSLIDCSKLYATAVFSGRQFDNLYPGRPAIVHVLGTDIDYRATVVDTRATQGSNAEERFAAPLPKLDDRQILAILRLDDAQALGSQKYCNVGRRVEVRFPESTEAAAAPRPAPQ